MISAPAIACALVGAIVGIDGNPSDQAPDQTKASPRSCAKPEINIKDSGGDDRSGYRRPKGACHTLVD
ncbi:MAG: hypothetical protein ACOYKQ_09035 [Polymorphobacter sp.]